MEDLYFELWKSLSKDGKEALMKDIMQKPYFPFKFIGIKMYEENNFAVFEDEDKKQFVFVPGRKNVTLGWNSKSCALSEKTIAFMKGYLKEELQYELEMWNDAINDEGLTEEEREDYKNNKPEEKNIEDWIKYIDSVMSPVRNVDIAPMIVEVSPLPVKRGYKAAIKSPFTLPTEDEWEYLRGCGERTLFYCEDFVEEVLNVIYGISMSDTDFSEKPNMFGLFFDSSTYVYEMVNSECFVKGADGGGSVCGGDGFFYTAPILSPFYRGETRKEHSNLDAFKYDNILERFYSYRRIMHI